MRYELKLHRLLLSMLVTLLALFVIGIFYMTSQTHDEYLEAALSLVVVIAVSAIFAYMGTAESIVAFSFGIKHRREFVFYLLLGLLSVGSGLYLALSRAESLQIVSLAVAPHALLFGLAELRIARSVTHHPTQRKALIFCGVTELVLGIVLVAGYTLSNIHVAVLLCYVALLTVLQLLPFLFYPSSSATVDGHAH